MYLPGKKGGSIVFKCEEKHGCAEYNFKVNLGRERERAKYMYFC